ncbi:MAG: hypothetical protein U1A78_40670 [Polyangia bacterium]
MKTLIRAGFALLLTASAAAPLVHPAPAQAQMDEPVDARAEKLLNDFLAALSSNPDNLDAAIKAALPYLHKSLLSPDGSSVSADLRNFSFKKAWGNAKFYAQPVKITRIRRTGTSAIGFQQTAEKGKVSDYFVAKKDGASGMPAPVKIFFPADGGEPKISYVGSL